MKIRVLIPIQFLAFLNMKHPPLRKGGADFGVFIIGLKITLFLLLRNLVDNKTTKYQETGRH